MLVLTRAVGEEILISGDIRVTVLSVHGQRVRLGITAPLSVQVARQELLDQRPDGAWSKARPSPADGKPIGRDHDGAA
jgi:carbon storage regulator